MNPAPSLYIASTPMIALSCAAAARAAGGRAQLVLIEDFDLAARLQAMLEAWRDTPFERIVRIPGRHAGPGGRRARHGRGAAGLVRRARAQRTARRDTIALLHALDRELQPQAVWLGNDRRVESQLSMELAGRRTGRPAGRYLDDGLYTYLGDWRPWRRSRWLDDLAKRWTYGRWWQRVAHAGTSGWIGEAWLAFPRLAPEVYPRDRLRAQPRGWYDNRAFARLCLDAARAFGVDRAALRGCDAVCVMPHSNQLRAEPAVADALREALRRMAGEGRRIALKYHPRESADDPGGLLATGAAMPLPGLLPMELLLPLLPRGAVLAGEITTALLAARWLRPDLAVRDLGLAQGPYAARARALFGQAGIPSLHGDLARAFGRAERSL